MSTIVTIDSSDLISDSRADLNTNFSNLNTDKEEVSNKSIDTALGTSDTLYPSQKAVKTYVDTQGGANASETARGIVEEATDAEVTAGTATGGTGAKLVVTPAKLATYNATQLLLPKLSYFISTCFETSTRFTSIADLGTNTFNTVGVAMATTATGTRAAGVIMQVGGESNNLFVGSPVFTCGLQFNTKGTTASSFLGIGLVTKDGSGHTYTTDHAGFKIVTVASVASLYATQGDGSTETASSALTTLAALDAVELMLKINGTSSIDYYWRKNGAAWSSATNLAANMPDTATIYLQFSVSNNATASNTIIDMTSATYSR